MTFKISRHDVRISIRKPDNSAFPRLTPNTEFEDNLKAARAWVDLYMKERISMKSNKGFTLLEMLVTVTIIGILTYIGASKFNKTVAANELEKSANNIYMELRGVRAIAMKYDENVYIRFSAQQCSIYVDTSGDKIRQANELYRVYKISNPVSIGIASEGPTSPPPGISWNSTKGIAGGWDSVFVISNSFINKGAIYIKNSRINKMTYCIGMSDSAYTFSMYKWSGTSWCSL